MEGRTISSRIRAIAAATLLVAACFPSPGPPAATAPPAATPPPVVPGVEDETPRRIIRIDVAPAAATVYVASPRGQAPANPTSIKLSATVVWSDGATDSGVVWRSAEGDRALVSPDGTVRAGLEAGEVKIFAEVPGAPVRGFATITVRTDAALEVGVE